MEHSYGARLDPLLLRPLERDDLELLRQWRNNKEISKYLRKIDPISGEQQIRWYEEYLTKDGIYFWAVVEDNKVIGALAIYDVHGDSAEIGKIMIGAPEARGKGYGYLSLISAMKCGIEMLGVDSYYLVVHEKNIAALKTYEKAGFEIVDIHPLDEKGNEQKMVIKRERFYEKNAIAAEIETFSAIRGGGTLE